MKIFYRTAVLLFVAAILISACRVGIAITPTEEPAVPTGIPEPTKVEPVEVEPEITEDIQPADVPTEIPDSEPTAVVVEKQIYRGVTIPSLDWWQPDWGFNENLTEQSFRLISSWNANIVRIPLNQRSWRLHSEYRQKVGDIVGWSRSLGMEVILDLHAVERGNPDLPYDEVDLHEMPDSLSVDFWSSVALEYKDQNDVWFELFSEPHNDPLQINPDIWLNGGDLGEYAAVGMQELYDTVRAQGAENKVVVNGLNWGFDHSQLQRLDGYNIYYGTHAFGNWPDNDDREEWDAAFGFLADQGYNVIIGSFGHVGVECNNTFHRELIDYAENKGISWVAWAWFPEGCEFPSLIEDWKGTPSPSGEVIREALQKNKK